MASTPADQDGKETSGQIDLNSLKQEIFLKLVVLGDLGVGKSSLIKKYTQSNESIDYKVSIDTAFQVKRVELDGRVVNIQLWDVPGHERYGGLTRTFYKYAHGALIVFDLSRPETFENALSWLSDVTEKLFDARQKSQYFLDEQQGGASNGALDEANRAMPIILLANKSDLPELKVPRHKYSSYVQENGLLTWMETSARDGSNFSLAIRRLVEYILETDPTVKQAKANEKFWGTQIGSR